MSHIVSVVSQWQLTGGMAMTFDEMLSQVPDVLRRDGRVSYWAHNRRCALDEAYLMPAMAEVIPMTSVEEPPIPVVV